MNYSVTARTAIGTSGPPILIRSNMHLYLDKYIHILKIQLFYNYYDVVIE